MIYTSLTKLAMQVAFDAHKEQKDKAGLPYIFHPFHLAEQMTDEVTVCTALLHDVVEDTDMTFEHLSKLGFTAPIVDVLELLTHEKSVPYMDYIKKIAENPVARAVKLADLLHNSDLSRLIRLMKRLCGASKNISRQWSCFIPLLTNENISFKRTRQTIACRLSKNIAMIK